MYVALADEEELSRRRADEVHCLPVAVFCCCCKQTCFSIASRQATQLASDTLSANSMMASELEAARSEIVRLREALLLQPQSSVCHAPNQAALLK